MDNRHKKDLTTQGINKRRNPNESNMQIKLQCMQDTYSLAHANKSM